MQQRENERRRGLRLVYATVVWNAFEGGVAIAAGIAASSVALTGYGLDSSIEVFVGGITAWQMTARTRRRDRPALIAIGVSYLVVAAYVGIESILRLIAGTRPDASPVGIALAASAAVVMTVLGVSKARIAREIGNRVLAAEARFSLVDAALSVTVLLGLLANAIGGWWWADPAVALVITVFALREGVEAIRGSDPSEGRRGPAFPDPGPT